ncbi:MAG: hypothetical protein JWQ07_4816 [Ramlibacter sp.]|nr:hypothetical protein [Ramlibacter sp.]
MTTDAPDELPSTAVPVAGNAASEKAAFYEASGMIRPESEENKALAALLAKFLGFMTHDEWSRRKACMLERISTTQDKVALKDAPAIRDETDEIAWYLYLAETAISDPLCLETNQAARALPYLVAIGQHLVAGVKVAGLDRKIKEVLAGKRSMPDGALFEMLVALSYAQSGWHVEMLEERPPAKTADLLVRRNGKSFFVECKRQSRRPKYSAEEHQHFLELWNGVATVLRRTGQWLWFDMVFHKELSGLPRDFLTGLLSAELPTLTAAYTLRDDDAATIRARPIDKRAVQRHMASNLVKNGSAMLRSLLGGDWAPKNSGGPMAVEARGGRVKGCENVPFGRWLEEIRWASGCTWACNAPQSIAAKARDIKRLLIDAARQVPVDQPSIIHIGIETLEGRQVDNLRAVKIRALLSGFKVDRPVSAVFVHSIQCNEVTDKPWEVDETVDWYFGPEGAIEHLPKWILMPSGTVGPGVPHWKLYP